MLSTSFNAVIKAVQMDNDTLKALGLEGEYVVDGPAASHVRDEENEILDRDGVWKGLDTWNTMGRHVDWEHQYRKNLDAKFLIGQGVKSYRDSDRTPRIASRLYKGNPYAESAWDLLLKGGELGYSVEGKATARDTRDRGRITGIKIYRVTLSPTPMGYDSRVKPIHSVLKALDEMDSDLVRKSWVEDSRMEDAVSALVAEGITEVPLATIQNIILKSYTTGAEIVGIGDGEAEHTASALRRQHLMSTKITPPQIDPVRRRKKTPKERVDALMLKGVDAAFATKLVRLDYEDVDIYTAWGKLAPMRRR